MPNGKYENHNGCSDDFGLIADLKFMFIYVYRRFIKLEKLGADSWVRYLMDIQSMVTVQNLWGAKTCKMKRYPAKKSYWK